MSCQHNYSGAWVYMTMGIYDVFENFKNFRNCMGIYDAEIGRRRRKFGGFVVENGDFLIENSMFSNKNQSKSRLQRAEGISRISEHIVTTKSI